MSRIKLPSCVDGWWSDRSNTPPDSGEREVCEHGRPKRAVCFQCLDGAVYLPLSLAQRILAALEAVPWDSRTDALNAAEAELRERMPK